MTADSIQSERKFLGIPYRSDKIIPVVILFLTGVSVLLVYSMRGSVVLQHLKHLAFAFAGLIFFYYFDYQKMGRLAPVALVAAVLLLIFTLLSEAVRGITIFGRDVQTFYMIGFMIIFYISNYIARQYNRKGGLAKNDVRYLNCLLLFFCMGIATLNMSTSIILFITGLVIFFVGGYEIKDLAKIVGIVSAALIVAIIVVMSIGEDNKSKIGRMATFVNRWEYYITKNNDNGYGDQMILARSAIARSGFSPAGPGNGVIKNRLPEKETDYAFASLFEETGIFVGTAIILAYLIILYRARKIANEASGIFGRLLAFGIGFWFTWQALVHIGVNCELLPTTGQTLPFISSGGASLVVSGCAMGILLSVAKVSYIENGKENPLELLRNRNKDE